jgi:hypothetical protein
MIAAQKGAVYFKTMAIPIGTRLTAKMIAPKAIFPVSCLVQK